MRETDSTVSLGITPDQPFELVAEACSSKLRRIVSEYFPPSGLEYDDLHHAALEGLWKATRDFDPDRSSFDTFASLCIRRNVITEIKTATREKHTPLVGYVGYDQELSEGDDSTLANAMPDRSTIVGPETAVLLREHIQNIFAAGLSELELNVYRLVHSGYSYRAIGEELDISDKTVDNAFIRAKNKIAKRVGQAFD